MKHLKTLLLLVCVFSTSCHFSAGSVSKGSRRGMVLAEKSDEAGRELRWRLYSSETGKPRVDRTESFLETTPHIGLRVGPVTRERAQSIGVEPFRGVWVTAVEPHSPAGQVGVATGDVVLTVNGVEMASSEQYEDYCDQNAVVGEGLLYKLRVYRRNGEPVEPKQSAEIEIVPSGRDIRQTSTNSIGLEGSRGILEFTGIQVASLPAELCKEMYGEDSERLVVAAVATGTPGYNAGLRAGDHVLSCDGKPVHSLCLLRAAVLARVMAKDLDGPLHDLGFVDLDGMVEKPSSKIVLEVEGPNGKHTASLGVADNLNNATHVHFPIVLNYDSDIRSADVSFLDFIFQFGFNYSSRVRTSTSRESIKTWNLSLFPLGMFEIEKGVTRNRYTLFWLLDF